MNNLVKFSLIGLLSILIVVGSFALSSWVLMILWGALASSFGFMTIRYPVAVLITVALGFVAGFFKAGKAV